MKGLEKKVVGFILAILFMLIVLILITRLLQVSAGKIDFNEIWDLSAGWKDEQRQQSQHNNHKIVILYANHTHNNLLLGHVKKVLHHHLNKYQQAILFIMSLQLVTITTQEHQPLLGRL